MYLTSVHLSYKNTKPSKNWLEKNALGIKSADVQIYVHYAYKLIKVPIISCIIIVRALLTMIFNMKWKP